MKELLPKRAKTQHQRLMNVHTRQALQIVNVKSTPHLLSGANHNVDSAPMQQKRPRAQACLSSPLRAPNGASLRELDKELRRLL